MSKKPADVPRRNDPTMTKITRNGYVKFCLGGRCGNKVKFTNAWVFSQIKPAGMFDNVVMSGLKKVSQTSRKTGKPTKKRYPNRMCACGDKYCNHSSSFCSKMASIEDSSHLGVRISPFQLFFATLRT